MHCVNQLNASQLQAADVLWMHYEKGTDLQENAFKNLNFHDGLAIQTEIRRRRINRGETQIGWKVGLTSDRARQQVGTAVAAARDTMPAITDPPSLRDTSKTGSRR